MYSNDDIGEETWHRLAGNLKENPDIWMDQAIISREVMVERMKDDIKSIWDATGGRIYLGGKEVQGSIYMNLKKIYHTFFERTLFSTRLM